MTYVQQANETYSKRLILFSVSLQDFQGIVGVKWMNKFCKINTLFKGSPVNTEDEETLLK